MHARKGLSQLRYIPSALLWTYSDKSVTLCSCLPLLTLPAFSVTFLVGVSMCRWMCACVYAGAHMYVSIVTHRLDRFVFGVGEVEP